MNEQQIPESVGVHTIGFLTGNRRTAVIVFLVAFLMAVLTAYVTAPPSDFPKGTTLTVTEGESLQQITTDLKDDHVIRSADIFRSLVIAFGGERRVVAGDYLLTYPQNVSTLAWRLIHGETGLDLVKITIPEGWTVKQMAEYLKTRLVNFDSTKFQKLSSDSEGYLFPDTYFVSPLITPDALIDKMKKNFDQKIGSIDEIKTFDKSLSDIVIMASMLEDEARTTESRQIVAGILWKRLSLGLPLQVDSTIAYVTGKTLPDLSSTDLKISSPYNTYIHTGLPPGPIGNPGVDALTSAVTPTTTPYLYYLSDKNGDMHYAKTFDEHKRNIAKYLQ